jgi:hypothetical protein
MINTNLSPAIGALKCEAIQEIEIMKEYVDYYLSWHPMSNDFVPPETKDVDVLWDIDLTVYLDHARQL